MEVWLTDQIQLTYRVTWYTVGKLGKVAFRYVHYANTKNFLTADMLGH